eukprot:2386972-Heterocapsa_arctica.AAC.2
MPPHVAGRRTLGARPPGAASMPPHVAGRRTLGARPPGSAVAARSSTIGATESGLLRWAARAAARANLGPTG